MTAPAQPLYLCLLAFGAGWGLLQPLNVIAVDGDFHPFGMMAWQGLVTLAMAGAFLLWRKDALPRGRAQWVVCGQLALLGTLLPQLATYTAVDHLPAGLMAILMASISILALPIGLALGTARAVPRWIAGLAMALAAVAIIAAGASWAILFALCALFCYALNSVRRAACGMAGLDPIRASFGAAILMLPMATALALATGQAAPLFASGMVGASAALLVIAAGHIVIYAGFLWLISRAGAVFASQTAFRVTGFGVFWSAPLLGERYPLAILAARA